MVAELDDLLLERLGRFWMEEIVDNDIGFLPGQFEDDRLTNSAIAPGDDGNLILQLHDHLPDVAVVTLVSERPGARSSIRYNANFDEDESMI